MNPSPPFQGSFNSFSKSTVFFFFFVFCLHCGEWGCEQAALSFWQKQNMVLFTLGLTLELPSGQLQAMVVEFVFAVSLSHSAVSFFSLLLLFRPSFYVWCSFLFTVSTLHVFLRLTCSLRTQFSWRSSHFKYMESNKNNKRKFSKQMHNCCNYFRKKDA